jgi:hypothetical protein
MNILFVTERRVDAGSIQALAKYVRAGEKFGYRFAIYGNPDPRIPEFIFSTELRAFDFVVFIFESRLKWMSGLQMAYLLTSVARSRRAVFDADGMYNPAFVFDDYDRNHTSEGEREQWLASYEALADRIFQPSFQPHARSVQPLLFYGYDPPDFNRGGDAKCVDIMHLGHNWWRWREVSERLLPAIERVRDQLDEISFVGLWWDAPPEWAAQIGQCDAFRVDPLRLRQLRIRTGPAVPYHDVIRTMSTARINIMTQRPVFRQLGLLTSKYFEIFEADTIPLVMLEPEHAARVYGPAGRELALHNDIADKLVDVLTHPERYQAHVRAVRQHLAVHHSYERRVQELVETLGSSGASWACAG